MNSDKLNVPNHLAIIMDGNGRWAKARNKPRSYGHLAGKDALKKVALYAFDKGIKVLSVFAFSTENFKRSKEEVDFLMELIINIALKEYQIFIDKNIKVIFSRTEIGLPKKVEEAISKLEEQTKNNNSGILNICINYGGRQEIVDTTKKLIEKVINKELSIEEINMEIFEKNLYYELPPIDLLIRTSGEQRISNFMLWQSAYSEMYFPKYHFPDFTEKNLDEAIELYNNRDRRFGGIKYEDEVN